MGSRSLVNTVHAQACASTMGQPKPSSSDGKIKAVAPLYNARNCSLVTAPASTMRSAIAVCAIAGCTSAPSGAPANTRRCGSSEAARQQACEYPDRLPAILARLIAAYMQEIR